MLVLHKFNANDHNRKEAQKAVARVKLTGLPRHFSICDTLEVEVVVFLSALMISKWMVQIKMRMSRILLSQVFFQYVANGVDIVEFFSNLDEESIELSISCIISVLGN